MGKDTHTLECASTVSASLEGRGLYVEAEIAAFGGHWQCQFLGAGLSCTQASDIGAPSAENVDFVVIQTHLSFGF